MADLVVLLLLLLERPDLVLPEVVLALHGVLEGIVVAPQLVVVAPQRVDLALAVVVGVEQGGQRVLQLRVEAPAVLERRLDLGLHGWRKRKEQSGGWMMHQCTRQA